MKGSGDGELLEGQSSRSDESRDVPSGNCINTWSSWLERAREMKKGGRSPPFLIRPLLSRDLVPVASCALPGASASATLRFFCLSIDKWGYVVFVLGENIKDSVGLDG